MHAFLEVAKTNKNLKGFMCCPCSVCRKDNDYSDWGTLHLHLIKNGFMENYVLWTRHCERGVVMEDSCQGVKPGQIVDGEYPST
jgi:hypothetical protein